MELLVNGSVMEKQMQLLLLRMRLNGQPLKQAEVEHMKQKLDCGHFTGWKQRVQHFKRSQNTFAFVANGKHIQVDGPLAVPHSGTTNGGNPIQVPVAAGS